MIDDIINEQNRYSYRPFYDRKDKCWRVNFPDRDTEEGDLLYVAGEYAETGLYYPYNDSDTTGKGYSGHAHSFDGVILGLLDDPVGFSVAGFEECYSQQEREMLGSIQKKLLADVKEQEQ